MLTLHLFESRWYVKKRLLAGGWSLVKSLLENYISSKVFMRLAWIVSQSTWTLDWRVKLLKQTKLSNRLTFYKSAI